MSDAELAELLEEVSLPGLAAKLGGLDAEADWGRLLSQGEQQRVALLRLLLHQPLVAFLDEASSPARVACSAALWGCWRRGKGQRLPGGGWPLWELGIWGIS